MASSSRDGASSSRWSDGSAARERAAAKDKKLKGDPTGSSEIRCRRSQWASSNRWSQEQQMERAASEMERAATEGAAMGSSGGVRSDSSRATADAKEWSAAKINNK